MSRLVRDDVIIGKSGVYLKEASANLEVVKTSFMNHVNSFKTNYEGVDATTIYNVLVNAINRIDELVKTLDYYSEYMLSVAKYDVDNIENSIKEIKSKVIVNPINQPKEFLFTGLEGVIEDESEQVKH